MARRSKWTEEKTDRRNSFSFNPTPGSALAMASYSASDSHLKEPSINPQIPEFLSEPFARLLKKLGVSLFIINTIYITKPDEPCDTIGFNEKNFKDLESQTLLLQNFVSHCTRNNIAIAFLAPIFKDNLNPNLLPQKDAAYSQRKLAFCRQLMSACLEYVKDPLSDDPYPFIGIKEYPHTDKDYNSICLAELAATDAITSEVMTRPREEEKGNGIFMWSFDPAKKKALIESCYPHLNFCNPEIMGRNEMKAFDDMVFFGQLIKEIGASPEIAKVTSSSRHHSRDDLDLKLPSDEKAITGASAAVADDSRPAAISAAPAPAPSPSHSNTTVVIGSSRYTSV